jgi:hypothetical protein
MKRSRPKTIGGSVGKAPYKALDIKKEQLANTTGAVPRRRKGAIMRKPAVSIKSRAPKYKNK